MKHYLIVSLASRKKIFERLKNKKSQRKKTMIKLLMWKFSYEILIRWQIDHSGQLRTIIRERRDYFRFLFPLNDRTDSIPFLLESKENPFNCDTKGKLLIQSYTWFDLNEIVNLIPWVSPCDEKVLCKPFQTIQNSNSSSIWPNWLTILVRNVHLFVCTMTNKKMARKPGKK